MQEKYMAEITERFAAPMVQIPLLPGEVKGLALLTELGEQVYQNGPGIVGGMPDIIEAMQQADKVISL
jgi:anaerobic glycerol-3-phosphate dehydrogenase